MALPYRCHDGQEDERCGDTFRITHHHHPDDGRLWSLYVPAFQGTLTVPLNGLVIASSTWKTPVVDTSALVPLLVLLPAPPLRPGDNTFELTLSLWAIPTGFLDAVAIGPDETLRPDYNTRSFLFSTLPGLTGGWQIAMGLALLLVWAARPRERIYLMFGILLVFLAMHSLPMIMGDRLPLWAVPVAGHGRNAITGSNAQPPVCDDGEVTVINFTPGALGVYGAPILWRIGADGTRIPAQYGRMNATYRVAGIHDHLLLATGAQEVHIRRTRPWSTPSPPARGRTQSHLLNDCPERISPHAVPPGSSDPDGRQSSLEASYRHTH